MARMTGRFVGGLAALFVGSLGAVAWGVGTPGTLDDGFSGDGVSLTAMNTTNTTTSVATAMDSEGRVVFAGYRRISTTGKRGAVTNVDSWHLVRTDANGALDSAFSADGQVDLYSGAGGQVGAQDVAVDTLDRVLAVGSVAIYGKGGKYVRNDLRVVRVLENGALDSSFGTSGAGALPAAVAGNDTAEAVAIQPDGKILVAGSRRVSTAAYDLLARFLPSGAIDTTFGSGGVLVGAAPDTVGTHAVLASDATGRILAVQKWRIDLRDQQGNLVWTAGNPFPAYANAYPYGAAFDASGNVVVAGTAYDGAQWDLVTARFVGSTGALDTTFDADGVFASGLTTSNTTWANASESAGSVVIQADGKIVLGGAVQVATGVLAGVLLRLDADGSYDGTFGPGTDGPGVSELAIPAGGRFLSRALGVYVHPVSGRLVLPFIGQDLSTSSYERGLAVWLE